MNITAIVPRSSLIMPVNQPRAEIHMLHEMTTYKTQAMRLAVVA
jgi:hypothetical protein